MMVNQEFLKSLPPNLCAEIELLIYKLSQEIITADEFYKEMTTLVDHRTLDKLLNIEGKDIKTEKLVDVIEYSGVDLKKETDIFNRDSVKQLRDYDDAYILDDYEHNDELEELLDISDFSDFLQKLCNSWQIGIRAECIQYFFKGLKSKLLEVIEKADFASKIRTDFVIQQFNVKVQELNDIKKQLYVLEEEERAGLENLRKNNPNELEDVTVEKPEMKEREDVLIKKKQANTLALQALGSKKTEFLDFDDDLNQHNGSDYPHVNLFGEQAIKEVERNIKTRRITVENVLFVLESDPKYEKSLFVIQHYFK